MRLLVGTDDGMSYALGGVCSGRTNYCALSAYNGGGESTLSAEVTPVVEGNRVRRMTAEDENCRVLRLRRSDS